MMNKLNGKMALVTGGSKGIGRGIVEVLAAHGVKVTALARDAQKLDQLKRDVNTIQTLAADVTNPQTASRSLRNICPDILVLNAGAVPAMAPVHELSWEQFNKVWDTDVKSTFFFGKEALLTPLSPGSVVIIVSSGAVFSGSPLSGSYAGAKRTQWFLAQYLQRESDKLNLGIRFIALIPRQIIDTTDVGNAAVTYYSAQQGITREEYVERMGSVPLTPEMVGQGVVSLLTDEIYREGLAFNINSQGLAAVN